MKLSQKFKVASIGCISVIVLGFTNNAEAQSGYYPTTNLMVPTPSPKVDYYSKFDGNPFLSEKSMNANIITNEGNQFNNVKVRYDLINDIIVSDKPAEDIEDGNPSIIKDISTLMLTDANNNVYYFESGFPDINSFNEKTLYQVMTNSFVKILKKPSKSVMLRTVYSSQPVKEIVASSKYYVYQNNKIVELKKNKESLLSTLSVKRSELENYVSKNHLNLIKDKDIDAVLSYYNTLQQF